MFEANNGFGAMCSFKFYLKWDLQQQPFFTGTRGFPFLKLHKCTIIFHGCCQAVFYFVNFWLSGVQYDLSTCI
jgi:hypothetical protein